MNFSAHSVPCVQNLKLFEMALLLRDKLNDDSLIDRIHPLTFPKTDDRLIRAELMLGNSK